MWKSWTPRGSEQPPSDLLALCIALLLLLLLLLLLFQSVRHCFFLPCCFVVPPTQANGKAKRKEGVVGWRIEDLLKMPTTFYKVMSNGNGVSHCHLQCRCVFPLFPFLSFPFFPFLSSSFFCCCCVSLLAALCNFAHTRNNRVCVCVCVCVCCLEVGGLGGHKQEEARTKNTRRFMCSCLCHTASLSPCLLASFFPWSWSRLTLHATLVFLSCPSTTTTACGSCQAHPSFLLLFFFFLAVVVVAAKQKSSVHFPLFHSQKAATFRSFFV